MSVENQGPEVGDVVFLFRLGESPDGELGASPLSMQHAILAALRQAELLPYGKHDSPERDARELAEFKRRGTMQKPQVRRYGRSGWNH